MTHSQRRAQEGRRRMKMSRKSFVESRFAVNSLSSKRTYFDRNFPSNLAFHILFSAFVSSTVESRGLHVILIMSYISANISRLSEGCRIPSYSHNFITLYITECACVTYLSIGLSLISAILRNEPRAVQISFYSCRPLSHLTAQYLYHEYLTLLQVFLAV
jgi:hypothetical protein